jgi:MFS family permease
MSANSIGVENAALTAVTPAQRRTLIAAALGWMLDAFDVMLYALVLAYIMRDLNMSKGTAGLLNTLMLLASGVGGVLFGFLADRVGRKRALALSILTYSVCSFACGLTQTVTQLAFFRFLLGLGMGGEWNTGATLVAETWPTRLRAKAMAFVQSSWAIGYALAALVSGIVLHFFNWRYVFFVGVLPALVTLWIRNRVPESAMWEETRGQARHSVDSSVWRMFQPPLAKKTYALLLVNFFGMFAWWGMMTWIPPYLSLPVAQGGRGFGLLNTTALLLTLNLAGMLPGYFLFGWFADWLGRKRAFTIYLGAAGLLVPLYAKARAPWAIMVTGTLVAFFGTGFFSGSGIIASELFPTVLRARALGITYNGARMLSASAPFVIGTIGQKHGLNAAFYLCALAFLLAGVSVIPLPETKGKDLD